MGTGVTAKAAAVCIRISSSRAAARSGCGKRRKLHCKEVVEGHGSVKAVPMESEEAPEMNSEKGLLAKDADSDCGEAAAERVGWGIDKKRKIG